MHEDPGRSRSVVVGDELHLDQLYRGCEGPIGYPLRDQLPGLQWAARDEGQRSVVERRVENHGSDEECEAPYDATEPLQDAHV